jgi:hypothetical protein
MAKAKDTIDILELDQGNFSCFIVGRTPIILNRMSEKARRHLLLPPRRKNTAERASTLRHDPIAEFRASPYTDPDAAAPTLLQVVATAFKGAMLDAALDMPGIAKTQIKRLVWVSDERVSLYGVPKLMLAVTRNSDINRTPDVRSRAIVPQWACRISIVYRKPILHETGIVNLLAAAGVTPGVGDWRVGKGSGNYGQFDIASADDPRLASILETGGREAQEAAMANPEPYDRETAELLDWFNDERRRRGFATVEDEDEFDEEAAA